MPQSVSYINTTLSKPVSQGIIAALVGTVLFSMKSILVKLAYAGGVNTEVLMAGRYGIALPIYMLIGIKGWLEAASERRNAARQLLLPATFLGVLGYWLSSYFDFLGLQYVSAQTERVVLYSYPLIVVALGYVVYRKKVGALSIAAATISYLGLALLVAHETRERPDELRGLVFVFASALSFAIYQLVAKPIIGRMGVAIATSVMMCAACLASLCTLIIACEGHSLNLSLQNLQWIILLSIGGTVLPSVLMNFALSRITSQASAAIGGLGPAITVAIAASVLGEQIGVFQMLAMFLVVGGGLWFSLREAR